VEFIHKGRISTIAVEREAILCAGAINSPQLLQLSGIGDGDHLSSVGVQPFHDLPGVGLNLQDHVSSSVKQLSLIPSLSRQLKPWNAALALLQYGLFRTGPVSGSGNEILTFVKTRPDLVAPDLEIILLLLLYTDHGRQINPLDGFSAHLCLQRPVSTGSVLIRSADPIVYPDIDPNYYSEPEDLATMRESIRVARDIISQDALSSFRGNEFAPGRTVQTPFELDEYIRASAETTYHASCSCKMGNDDLAVVDDQLRVRGLKGLRVADASVMPRVVSGNTNATTVMIAERAADFLLNRTLQAPREFQTELVPFESSKGDQRGSVMN
jgi:choline dehydrogenase